MSNQDPASPPPEVIEALAKNCRCCPCCQNPPCDGVMAGGLCDEVECDWSDNEGDDWREVDDEESEP